MNVIDGFARKILRLLQADSRRSAQELSEHVGLSATPCWRRIKDMEQSGVIQRYTVLLDREKLGFHICALAHIQLTRHTEGGTEQFEREISTCPEVTECYSTTGEADYILKIVAPDIKAYDEFLHSHVFRLPAVAQVKTSVVLREIKFDTSLPL
ncbi:MULTISPECIES: Lrp/AsnC family transcriptional regulator [Pandoraea]|uniref:AsnC family transcriptional regulator n=1 Tax=Pandoraea thiooxydans TaxID=445709 RepID=A0A0G3EY29_9BURK|nr:MULTISPECIES: Lrp/AsnC family transcriptional regulator [Pandoraea]MBU6492447.1 Lrp/AsnC family transcriptional regulator [Burkholderiales bacterium]AKJ69666.1 AsnC family transcriptional regulator [Pandoraea thiooxydans]APR97384.1 transcriptional regulator, AsnC family protein [Pandoraea thiooxydans]MDE2289512.1 Lrp/AsnC family transcriptional regulator [Burkholderiales bacterium]MDE2610176.1 Lrp/AsnC family transcriptional regulator [Burkholderiales bacterium]